MDGILKILNLSCDITTPVSGMVCHPTDWDCLQLTCVPNIVSMFTHYEDMKGIEKCTDWGG